VGGQQAVIIAVISMTVVKLTIAKVINVITVRYTLVPHGLVIARASKW
jgi:hypothetical protein